MEQLLAGKPFPGASFQISDNHQEQKLDGELENRDALGVNGGDDAKLIQSNPPRKRGRKPKKKRQPQQQPKSEPKVIENENCARVSDDGVVNLRDGVSGAVGDDVGEIRVNDGNMVQGSKRKLGFDLNLDASDYLDEAGIALDDGEDEIRAKRGRFDLNLGSDQLMDVAIDLEANHLKMDDASVRIPKEEFGFPNQTLGFKSESVEANGSLTELNMISSLVVSNDEVGRDITSTRKEKLMVGFTENVASVDHRLSDDYSRATLGRRRGRRPSENLKPAPGPALRRSARKSGATYLSSRVASSDEFSSHTENYCPKAIVSLDIVDMSSSNVVCDLTEQGSGFEELEDINLPPAKLQLPDSSQNLNLDGVSVLDLIAVYSFLKSFSTLLFLSPFELEDFHAAIKCKSATSLLDQTHVALLQTLRKHLQFLSAEGSQSAADCLRSLDWDFLDPVTWPLFIAEYLLTMKPDFDVGRLKLSDNNYYKQPESQKVDILRILCDDLIDADCIRSELNRRASSDEFDVDPRVTNIRNYKKRKASMDFVSGSSLTDEIMNETSDWNSDECCLCKVDGNLICCDGCPAAYHSRCVGVASDLLPEGDWYCPECNIDRDKRWMQPKRSFRGAEFLGVDPDGRTYLGSCGYLLVLDSHDDCSNFSYYCRNDVSAVIKVLKTSDIRYGALLNTISDHWTIPVHDFETRTSQNQTLHMGDEDFITSSHLPLKSSDICANMVQNVVGHEEDIPNAAFSVRNHVEVICPVISSEGSAEISHVQAIMELQKSGHSGANLSKGTDEVSTLSPDFPKNLTLAIVPLIPATSFKKLEQNPDSSADAHASNVVRLGTRSTSQEDKTVYSNRYSMAQVASSVVEDLYGKTLDKMNKGSFQSTKESISTQLKAISKKCTRFCWESVKGLMIDAWTEKCGWCFCCKEPEAGMDCLVKLNNLWPNPKVLESESSEPSPNWIEKGHLVDVISYVLSIESRLQGLLRGPWLNPHHSANWSRDVWASFNLASVKNALLTLEINLHSRAFLTEWFNFVDSTNTVGSASYDVTSSSFLGSKHSVSRQRGRSRHADSEVVLTSNAAIDSDFFWRRGGRLSRHIFSWKVLPRSSALKAARQAGRNKIPGILYPEGLDLAKRRRNIVWRAAVETSSSVEQLAYQIRELDSYIKWDEIENSSPFTKIDKKLMKVTRAFKKVIIRRKCSEGALVKYLLDFGKRKIPDIVVTHGSMTAESATGRKRYWLEESHVPLHLLKSFEDSRITRKNYKMKPRKLLDGKLKKGCSRLRGFSYLFSRAVRLENYECGHCKKIVPARESVSCQSCEGFFHKQHVRRSKGNRLADAKYMCHKCHQDKFAEGETRKELVKSYKRKKVTVTSKVVQRGKIRASSRAGMPAKSISSKAVMQMPLRRSTRKIKFRYVQMKTKKRSPRKTKPVPVVNQKAAGRKRGRPAKLKKPAPKRVKELIPRGRRTKVCRSYWLNGLKLTRNSDDHRLEEFKREKLLVPSEDLNVILNQPICKICAQFTSRLIYIWCEGCEGWFHGGAFGVNADKAKYVIGFKCHSCLSRPLPVCPVPNKGKNREGPRSVDRKNGAGKGSSSSLCRHDMESERKSQQSAQIVDHEEGKSVIPNSNQTSQSEALVETENKCAANGIQYLDSEVELSTESSVRGGKGCTTPCKVDRVSPDPASEALTSSP